MRTLAADVLVLGAGLAGLRAALGCLEADAALRVLVACPTSCPSGSSFANPNDQLGMLVCLTDTEQDDFRNQVCAATAGAYVDPALVAVLAEESRARFEDLLRLGLPFAQSPDGVLVRQGSCFAPQARRAFVVSGLARAHQVFMRRLAELGCAFAFGQTAAAFIVDTDGPRRRVAGALLQNDAASPTLARAKVVIAALGGPAPLFAHSLAPQSALGFSHGLLAEAGAPLANTGYLQYLWGALPSGRFWQPAELAQGGFRVRTSGGGLADPVADLAGLADLAVRRAEHCPYGYALPDSALDLALAEHLDETGGVDLTFPSGVDQRLAPMAHATNGGAVIDRFGQTGVAGLLACGECATGMHGANRLGGAMALATQIFGHRAGHRAAELAAGRLDTHGEADVVADQAEELAAALHVDPDERRAGLHRLGVGLSRYAVLGSRPGFEAFRETTAHELTLARDWRLRLALRTALTVSRVPRA